MLLPILGILKQFDPPIVTLFGVHATALGLPVLYFYLFAAWLAVIALAGLIVGRGEPVDAAGEAAARVEREA